MPTNASVDDPKPAERDPAGEVAEAFDRLAERHGGGPVRPARGYHEQIEALYRADRPSRRLGARDRQRQRRPSGRRPSPAGESAST